jgi:hypothetical protein
VAFIEKTEVSEMERAEKIINFLYGSKQARNREIKFI